MIATYLNELKDLILRESYGQKDFTILYKRVTPKCEKCGFRVTSKELETCPTCREKISKFKEATATIEKMDMKNFIDEKHLIYFDADASNGKGGFRSCRIENIRCIGINGKKYCVLRKEEE